MGKLPVLQECGARALRGRRFGTFQLYLLVGFKGDVIGPSEVSVGNLHARPSGGWGWGPAGPTFLEPSSCILIQM